MTTLFRWKKKLLTSFVAILVATLDGVDGFSILPSRPSLQLRVRTFLLDSKPETPKEGSRNFLEIDSGTTSMDRRSAFVSTGMAILSLWFGLPVLSSCAAAAATTSNQNILITGCNSGIGYEAARILATQGHTLIMACRTFQKAQQAASQISNEISDASVIPAECDLASQESIRKFVRSLDTNKTPLDVVCYNAGVSLNTDDPQIQRTSDGFELTVGTNHLGHFYLHHLLESKIASNGRVVITASAVHDPDSPGGAQGQKATLGDLLGFTRDGKNFEMVDGSPYNGDKAYKDSKLCNVFFCRELQQRLSNQDATKDITVNAFSPGLITSTGLFRNQSPVFSSIFGVLATNVFKVAESPAWGGAALAFMTTVTTKGQYYNSPPGSSKYGMDAFGREFTIDKVSVEAQDKTKGERLWELSEKLVGIST